MIFLIDKIHRFGRSVISINESCPLEKAVENEKEKKKSPKRNPPPKNPLSSPLGTNTCVSTLEKISTQRVGQNMINLHTWNHTERESPTAVALSLAIGVLPHHRAWIRAHFTCRSGIFLEAWLAPGPAPPPVRERGRGREVGFDEIRKYVR